MRILGLGLRYTDPPTALLPGRSEQQDLHFFLVKVSSWKHHLYVYRIYNAVSRAMQIRGEAEHLEYYLLTA